MQTQEITYQEDGITFKAFVTEQASKEKRPLVLVVHDWNGRGAFPCEKAKRLAEFGYIGVAVDMYGEAKCGKTKEENASLMQPLIQDRALLLRRITAAFNSARQLPGVDKKRIGGIGFCFGGLCLLDLARSGTEIHAVVSFHAALYPPKLPVANPIKTKILALHGADDPMVKIDEVLAFQAEMTAHHADWQLYTYGHAMHGFTNPQANDANTGIMYNESADKRAWQAMRQFFTEVFA